ncbi:hypothetical protein ACQUFY_26930 (plasmid) [Robbsia andropogonis]|uniref:hypothetical protein n=1 Tax=Robbsia andropogonis TaxID=28092 RepID=UPI003D1FD43B
MSRVQFPVGDVFVEFEGNSGHAPGHPETLTASVRAKTAKGRPARREHVSFSVKRSAVLKFALQMLELSEQMLPESLFLESGVIGVSNALPALTGIDAEEQRALERILGKTRPLDVAARAMDRYENLRRHVNYPALKGGACSGVARLG